MKNPDIGPRVLLVTAAVGAIAVILLLYLLTTNTSVSLSDILRETEDALAQVPLWAYVLLICFGCSLPIPSSPFFLSAGVAYGLPEAIGATLLGLLGNLTLSYYIGRFAYRVSFRSISKKFNVQIPEVKNLRIWELILIIRLIPAIPMVIQSYILGMTRTPVGIYLVLSWPLVSLGAIGLLLAGRGLVDQKFSLIILAATWILTLGLICRWIFRLIRNRSED